MTPELTYLIKVNIAIMLFYVFYRSLCTQDTFFRWRRFTLLGFWCTAWIYPLMNLQNWMQQQIPVQELLVYTKTFYLSPYPISTTGNYTNIQWEKWGIILYLAGITFFGLRFLIRLFSICQLAYQSPTQKIGSTTIRILNNPGGPFSFFKWIFIHPDSMHSECETQEILAHEQTHVQEWHSFDILFSELSCILCWINPLSWLLKREVRTNLEYQADHQVITSGHNSKSYQYHLLRLAHQKAAATLYNHFNVLPIKKRIMMINKKRTRNIGRTKYFTFFLLATALMVLSNIESIANNSENYYHRMVQKWDSSELEKSPETVITAHEKSTYEITPKTNDSQATIPQKEGTKDQEEAYDKTEVMASFPGGKEEMYKFLNKNMIYPKEAQKKGITGKVFIRFVIEKDGSITNVKVVRTLDPDLEKEAVRVVKAMPKWNPGKMRGKAVKSYFVLPIEFNPKLLKHKESN